MGKVLSRFWHVVSPQMSSIIIYSQLCKKLSLSPYKRCTSWSSKHCRELLNVIQLWGAARPRAQPLPKGDLGKDKQSPLLLQTARWLTWCRCVTQTLLLKRDVSHNIINK